ncbi:hypothetical protein BU17DRAFT_62198 [Hysterangium stoloniferum]|nr:hypothetical protein BU17DRAFT_62198 [Hysterangium stoloniferum]
MATGSHLSSPRSRLAIITEDNVNSWTSSFASASTGQTRSFKDFIVKFQAVARSHLVKKTLTTVTPFTRLSRVSSAPSLTNLTREARYARAEAALRLALSKSENEPSPLELQVRVMAKGLQAWNSRAARGQDRVQKAEEALAAVRQSEEASASPRNSLPELHREKWMGMKERDEALAMVDKIKKLIVELNAEIKAGSKKPSLHPPAHPILSLPVDESEADRIATSKKAAILFSGKIPSPYLERLPRLRRSVEPLQLPLRQQQQVQLQQQQQQRSRPGHRRRASTLVSLSSTAPSTPLPLTPTMDDFGAIFIHSRLSLKTAQQYATQMDSDSDGSPTPQSHVRLPSYVDALLDELAADRIGSHAFDFGSAIPPPLSPSSSSNASTTTTTADSHMNVNVTPRPSGNKLPSVGSRGFLGRPFSRPASGSPQSKENHDPLSASSAARARPVSVDSTLASPSVLGQQDLSSPARKLGKMGNMMQSVKNGVKRVSRRG